MTVRRIDLSANKIAVLANSSKPVSNEKQAELDLAIDRDAEIQGVGMGVLSDGTPYLTQRGLAALCGVQNAHIGTISSQWSDLDKPRISAIKAILQKMGLEADKPHIEILHRNVVNFCYPAEVCLAVLEYYAFDAGQFAKIEARDNYRLLAGSKLRDLIYRQVGYDPAGNYNISFQKWHERIELNYQSAPRGFFHVFNEAHTIVYELIVAGANIGDKTVVDISIGQHWSKHWESENLEDRFGERSKYPHRYPDSHPQSKSNPQESWCYPIDALGEFRRWMQDVYIEGGKFRAYLSGKEKKGELAPSIAQLAIAAVEAPLKGMAIPHSP